MRLYLARQIVAVLTALVLGTFGLARAADTQTPQRMSVLTSDQVIQILDQTVTWYRTLGAQQQSASQPSDLLILYSNRQIATQVVTLAFDLAKANAELLSSDASASQTVEGVAASAQSLNQLKSQLDAQAKQLQTQIDAAGAKRGQKVSGGLTELQGRLAMLNARRNLVDTMSQFVNGSDSKVAGANALKTYIDALEASVPQTATTTAPTLSTSASDGTRRLGIWDLGTNALRLSQKLATIDGVSKNTTDLQGTFQQLRSTPLAQIQALSARGNSLATEGDQSAAVTGAVRDQFDTLAWQFKQTAEIVLPLSKEQVLLQQYRHNLSNWRVTVERQYHDALLALATRVGALLLILLALFAGAELWRRAVIRYEHELRRRHQWLLVRRITLWILVVATIGFTFITQLSSMATFAGLITAGVAVALQSVIVSMVGYFFLIGKYGVRVGDRVQIGDVSGEVIELGLVRMHVMEMGAPGHSGPTGRIVAFANSIVFQASGGLFRQLPGVNFTWHELTLSLPPGVNYGDIKQRLLQAVSAITQKYQAAMVRESSQLEDNVTTRDARNVTPQVQLRFSAAGVDALVRYPVLLQHAAEIDEQISEQLFTLVASLAPQLTHTAAS